MFKPKTPKKGRLENSSGEGYSLVSRWRIIDLWVKSRHPESALLV
jgi:hypothetical protein